MKLSKTIVVIVVIAILGVLAWRFLPGCRQKAIDAYRKHGGWTEEARRADPVGFIEYAEQKLSADLDKLTDSRRSLGEAGQKIADELKKTAGLQASAGRLAETFRTAYRAAVAKSAWPVEVSGATYAKQELVEQVRLILTQKTNYAQIVGELERAAVAVKNKAQQLVTQINTTKATLAVLPAKKEIARVNKLTRDIEDLLGQINALLGDNDKALSDSPIRTVEELVDAKGRVAAAAEGSDDEAKAFLEAKE